MLLIKGLSRVQWFYSLGFFQRTRMLTVYMGKSYTSDVQRVDFFLN